MHYVLSQSLKSVTIFAIGLSLLAGCSGSQAVPDGYWRSKPPLQSRILNNVVIKVEQDRVWVLSYFGGPLLNSGVNTEMTEKTLMGNVRCGEFITGDSGTRLLLETRFEIGGAAGGDVINSTFPVEVRGDSLFIDGLLNYPEIPYVLETELSNEEALVFQQYLNACKDQ